MLKNLRISAKMPTFAVLVTGVGVTEVVKVIVILSIVNIKNNN